MAIFIDENKQAIAGNLVYNPYAQWMNSYILRNMVFMGNYYEGTPPEGYYRTEALPNPLLIRNPEKDSTKREGRLRFYYDEELGKNVTWFDVDPRYGISSAGYYYYGSDTSLPGWKYILVTSTPKIGPLDFYTDEETDYPYSWCDTTSYEDTDNATGYEGPGYYQFYHSKLIQVSTTPVYTTDASLFPGMAIPEWFKDSATYDDSLSAGTRKLSSSSFPWLLYANLVDKNPDGINGILDDLLATVFGDDFDAAYARMETLTESILMEESTIRAFGIDELLELENGEEIYIGKAELKTLFAALRVVKASLQWVAAYDWDADVNFLKDTTLWDPALWDNFSTLNKIPARLPLRGTALTDRRNDMMDKSKTSFIQAIDDLTFAYDSWLTGKKLPGAYQDYLTDYIWIQDGLAKFKAAINSGGNFYVKEHSTGTKTYDNTESGAIFGMNMGKFFTPGQLSIDKLLETVDVAGKGKAPNFYGYNGATWTAITAKNQIASYEMIGIKIKSAPLSEIAVYGFDDVEAQLRDVVSPIQPVYAEVIWDWYHN